MKVLFTILAILSLIIFISLIVCYITRYKYKVCKSLIEYKLLYIIQIVFTFIALYIMNLMAYGIEKISDLYICFSYVFESFSFEIKNENLLTLISTSENLSILISVIIVNLCLVVGLSFSVIVSVLEKFIDNWRNIKRVKKALRKKCDILIGLNEMETYLKNYNSSKEDYSVIIWSNSISKEKQKELLIRRIPFILEDFTAEALLNAKFKYLFKNDDFLEVFVRFLNENRGDNEEIVLKKKDDANDPKKVAKKEKLYNKYVNKFQYIYKKLSNNYFDIREIYEKVKDEYLCSKYKFISLDNENINIHYISEFIKFISTKTKKGIEIYDSHEFDLYVEIGLDNLTTIQDKILSYRDNSNVTISPFIHCFNRYEINAIKMCEEYPITKFLPKGFIDCELPAINNDKKNKLKQVTFIFNGEKQTIKSDYSKMLNVVFLGFGKISRELYSTFVMNNQIPSFERKNGKTILGNHLINYFLFDKKTLLEEEKNNLYYYQRYNNERYIDSQNKNKYYDKPLDTHKVYTYPCDINSNEVLDALIKIVGQSDDKYTSIVISLGEDLDNIDYALKVNLLLSQMSAKNFHIFVRVNEQTHELEKYLNQNFTFFGSKSQIFNHDSIINDNLDKIAKIIDKQYNDKNQGIEAKKDWYKKESIKHISSKFSALNLRLKMNLLGYDYSEKVDNLNIDQELESEINKKIKYKEISNCSNQEKLEYKEYLFFKKDNAYSAANIIAYQEKLRWNAMYIFHGYAPLAITAIKFDNDNIIKENYEYRLHACLTTYECLDKYHKHCAKIMYRGKHYKEQRSYKEIKQKLLSILRRDNTYQYDYNLLDKIPDLFFGIKPIYYLYSKYPEDITKERINTHTANNSNPEQNEKQEKFIKKYKLKVFKRILREARKYGND